MQQVIDLLLYEITHKLVERYTAVGAHGGGAQLDLGLALKNRFLNVQGNCGHYAVTNIAGFKVLAVELLDGTGYMLLERALMRTSL